MFYNDIFIIMKQVYVPSKIKVNTETKPWNRFRKQLEVKETQSSVYELMETLVDKAKRVNVTRR